MSTRSHIGIEDPDGKVRAIYCHFDGYLYHNGKILLAFYATRDKVEMLVAGGTLSALDEETGEAEPAPSKFPPLVIPDRETARSRAYRQEYVYVFTSDGWIVSDHGAAYVPLTAEICEKDL